MSYFTHNYLRLSPSSHKYDRNNSQILSFAFDFFIYSIIAPDLGLIVDQVLRQTAPWINWVYCFLECSRDFYVINVLQLSRLVRYSFLHLLKNLTLRSNNILLHNFFDIFTIRVEQN